MKSTLSLQIAVLFPARIQYVGEERPLVELPSGGIRLRCLPLTPEWWHAGGLPAPDAGGFLWDAEIKHDFRLPANLRLLCADLVRDAAEFATEHGCPPDALIAFVGRADPAAVCPPAFEEVLAEAVREQGLPAFRYAIVIAPPRGTN